MAQVAGTVSNKPLDPAFIAKVIAAGRSGATWPAIGKSLWPTAKYPDRAASVTFHRNASNDDIIARQEAMLTRPPSHSASGVGQQAARRLRERIAIKAIQETPPDFNAHNLTFPEDRRSIARPEHPQTYGGVGSAWMGR